MAVNSIISIIIPSFNRAEFIAETLESVISQTSPNWECIIVDDGSTDNSIDIIKSFIERDNRFKLFFRDREPKGACTCRNIGVDECSGDYVIFLDTDDILAPFCIEQRLNSITEDLDFAIFPAVYFRYRLYDLNLWWNIDKPGISELERQLNHDAICQGTGPLFKKESFIKMGKWNEELLIWQDIELFFNAYIRNFKYSKFFNLPPDIHIRNYEASISRGGYYQLAKIKSRETVVRNTFKLLIDNKKQIFVNKLYLFGFEVADSYYKSKNFVSGDKFIVWMEENGIINKTIKKDLKKIRFIVKFKLSRFSKKILKKINNKYSFNSTIGKIKYKNE